VAGLGCGAFFLHFGKGRNDWLYNHLLYRFERKDLGRPFGEYDPGLLIKESVHLLATKHTSLYHDPTL